MEFRKRSTYVTPDGRTETVDIAGHVLTSAEAHNERVNWTVQAIAAVVAFANALLFLRIAFLLFDAGRTGFVQALYALTEPVVRPFQGLIPASLSVAGSGATLDTAAILAMVAVTLAGWALSSLVGLSYRSVEHDF